MKSLSENPALRWQLGLAALVGLFLIGTAASVVLAGRKVSRIVDVDYYEHGLHYADSMRRNVQVRQWSLIPTLAKGVLRVEVRSKNGVPVTGGTMEFLPRQGNHADASKVELSERAPGVYMVATAGSPVRHGSLHFTKGGATLDTQVALFE